MAALFSTSKSIISTDDVMSVMNTALTQNTLLCDKNGQVSNAIQTCPGSRIRIPGGISQKAAQVLLSKCAQNTSTSNDVSNTLAQAIVEEANSKPGAGAGLLFNGVAMNDAEVRTNLSNMISTSISNITTLNCDVTAGISNTVNLCGDVEIGNIDQSASIQISSDCSQVADVMNKLANDISQSLSVKATSGSDMALIIAAIVLIIGIVIFGWTYMGSNDDDDDSESNDRPRHRNHTTVHKHDTYESAENSAKDQIFINKTGRGEKHKKVLSENPMLLTYNW